MEWDGGVVKRREVLPYNCGAGSPGRLRWLDIIHLRRRRLRRPFERATRFSLRSQVTLVHDQEEGTTRAALSSSTVIRLVKLADLVANT